LINNKDSLNIPNIGEKWDNFILQLPLLSPLLIEVSYFVTLLPDV